jgi:hypothetical protein
VSAEFVCTSRDSRIKVTDPSSQFIINTAITGFDGTLEVVDTSANRLQGQTITFNNGHLESGTLHAFFKGKYDPASTDSLKLEGSHRLRCDSGTVLPAVSVSGSSNTIEGSPLFSGAITLADSSSILNLGLQTKLNQNIVLNTGKIVLNNVLELGDDVTIGNDGTVDFNAKRLALPSKDSTWSTTLYFDNASDLVLNGKTTLSGMWVFGPSDGSSVMNGNGNVLDMTLGGTIWVRSGHGLALTDVTIKGLGHDRGWFLLEDENATLSLVNVTLALDESYTITQGQMYVYGSNSHIITADKYLTFNQSGKLKIDRAAFIYDPLNTSTTTKNVVPYEEDDTNLYLLNGGRLRAQPDVVAEVASEATLTYDDANNALVKNQDLSSSHKITFRGNASSTVSLDGAGFICQMPRAATAVIVVSDNKHALLSNVVLKDFSPAHIQIGTGASFRFGDDVYIQLADNASDLTYTWSFDGNSTIDGRGKSLTLAGNDSIRVNDHRTLTVKDTVLHGVKTINDGIGRIYGVDPSSKIILDDVTMYLDGTYNYSHGALDINNNVKIRGNGKTIAYTSTTALTINSNSQLFCDRGVTFSYDSRSAAQDKIVFTDASSQLYFNASTLHVTNTGLHLQTGAVLFDDKVTVSAEATQYTNEAVRFNSNLKAYILAGASLNVLGIIKYE